MKYSPIIKDHFTGVETMVWLHSKVNRKDMNKICSSEHGSKVWTVCKVWVHTVYVWGRPLWLRQTQSIRKYLEIGKLTSRDFLMETLRVAWVLRGGYFPQIKVMLLSRVESRLIQVFTFYIAFSSSLVDTWHYSDIIMSAMTYKMTNISSVCSTVC